MKRPIVPTAIRTEFGEVLDTPEFHDIAGSSRDLSYVPGFSEMRRERDLLIADVAAGRVPAHEAKLKALPVNLRWVRASTPKGAPDALKQIASGNLGYKAVNKSDVGKQSWLTALPPGATIDPDGSIRKGDTVLMVTDAASAGKNSARRQAQTRTMVTNAVDAAGGLLSLSNAKAGTDAFVKKEA